MKKHLIASAVVAAIAAPAMAQNVSIYGALDAGVASIQNATAAGDNLTGFIDGNLASSVWGLRGSEDLGGGLRAVFHLESDVQLNNGGTNQHGLFRRAAVVGLAGGFGTVELGTKLNPVIATNGALMPLAGNAVSTIAATAMNYADFYTRNSVTWTSNNMNGLVLQGQYGFDNTATVTTPGGRVWAASGAWATGPLSIRVAHQNRTQNGSTSSANASGTDALPDKTTTIAGLQYSVGPWAVGAAMMRNEYARTPNAQDNNRIEIDGSQFGVRYSMTPALTLGGSYTTSEGSSLTNLQARYTLSKRTTTYVSYGRTDNSANAPLRTLTNATTAARVQFAPTAGNTGSSPAALFSGYAAQSGNQSAIVGGIIHTF